MRVVTASNLEEYQRNWAMLTKVLGNDLREAVRKEGKIAYQTLGEETPPKTFAKGRKNVATQLRKAVSLVSLAEFPEEIRSPLIRKLVRERNYSGLQAIVDQQKSGPLRGVVLKPFTRSLHEDVRNSRGGVSKDQKIGTLDRAEWKAHLKRKQNHVGMAKGGWATATLALGGRVRNFAAKWASMGSFKNELDSFTDMNVQATNSAPWADGAAESEAVNRAFWRRSGSMKVALAAALQGAAYKTLRTQNRMIPGPSFKALLG